MLPIWVYILIAVLFGWLVMPRIAAYTGMKAA